jgi:Fe-S cluster assembly ATP-binding protein
MAFQYPIDVPGVSFKSFLRTALNAKTPKSKQLPISDFIKLLESTAISLDIPLKLLDRDINQDLSGGEKKKMEILQMVILKPKYAILDEIDSGLDIDANKTIYSAIKEIAKKTNIGIIIITHYEKILEYLTPDFVYILNNGKIIEQGEKELVERISKHGFKTN